jgi:transposase
MNRSPKINEARALDNRIKAWKMIVTEGLDNHEAAAQLGVSTRTVARYLRRTLETESRYPADLSPEKIAELRQIQAEVLSSSRRLAVQTQAIVRARIGTAAEKGGDAQSVARLLEAVVRAVDMESSLFGTKQPTRIVEEQMRLQVNLTRVGDKPMLTWDRSILEKPVRHVEGLTIYEGCRNNGDTAKQLPDTASN